MTRRRWLWVGLLLIAAMGGVLAYGTHKADGPTSKKPAITASPSVASAPLPVPVATPEPPVSPRVIVAEAGADLFAAKSWYVAPPPPPPPKPEAPPLPYVFAGSMLDGDAVTLFVSQGERNYILHQGDQVGTNYRLDEIRDGVATFTYLPLQQQQTLQIGTDK